MEEEGRRRGRAIESENNKTDTGVWATIKVHERHRGHNIHFQGICLCQGRQDSKVPAKCC